MLDIKLIREQTEQVSAALGHSCGVTTDHRGYCWGRGATGQLGYGGTDRKGRPILVAGGIAFSGITTGNAHTCGTDTGGRAWCWGLNASGQVGDGTSLNQRLTPVRVSGGLRFDAVLASFNAYTCGIATSLAANATDPDGDLESVRWLVDGVLMSAATTSMTFAGSHELRAVATDERGAATTASPAPPCSAARPTRTHASSRERSPCRSVRFRRWKSPISVDSRPRTLVVVAVPLLRHQDSNSSR